ncbi:MAG: hypothetical protein GXN93_03035 [Candidatus Diapherotrites archaeon]|nr:hypothetical protein [Candidatus Diapherotrites archaeon]
MKSSSSSGKPWKLPPRIKVYEAMGAIADGRVRRISDTDFSVLSSDGSRSYHVVVRLDENRIASDDNGSRYKGYLGYPAIAVLMLLGVLPFDKRISKELAGIPWRQLNERFGRYDLTERWVLERVSDPEAVKNFVDNVLNALRERRFYPICGVQQTLF